MASLLFFFYSVVCFVLLSQSFSSSSFVDHLCSPSEAFHLLQFNQSFQIFEQPNTWCVSSFPKTQSWNESRDCCSWDGITCDVFTGYVIGLELRCSQLYGRIHPNSSLFQLHHLQTLDLAHNNFYGTIPDSIGNLTQIKELYLNNNHFTGSIPFSVGNLTQIKELELSYNNFTGLIPSSIFSLTHVESLYLASNSLSGPLPSNASMLQKLSYLNLHQNSLSGTIPSWLFSLTSISRLSLRHNQFSRVADEIKTNQALESLDLSHNQLSGPFPQSLENLTYLIDIDLSSNNITSDAGIRITFPSLEVLLLSSCELKDFPHFLRNLKTLEVLDLSNNKIHGLIPNWFNRMRRDSLRFLNLSHNSLTGHLEQIHYYNLRSLDLKFNFLQGPLPSSICNMSSLIFLDLTRNNFSSSVPSCLGNMVELSILDLRRNNFSGSIPPLCNQSTSLRTIVLNDNRFVGTLPMSLLNCHELEVLDVGNNAINDTFPAWLGTIEELQVLILKSNKFHGPISTKLKVCFAKLRIFDLSQNEFSGSLPAEVFRNFKAMIRNGTHKGKITYMETFDRIYALYEVSVRLVIKGNNIELERISTIMTSIDLSSNHFEGVIPNTLKDLDSLWLLNLSHNNFKGDIPTELGQLNMLEALDLSWNRLTGKIPQELTRIKFLAVLNLSQNHLVGPIPQGPQFNTFSNDSYGGNLDLCGPPLSKQCGMSDPPLETEEEEEESYFASGFTWESVVIGYSCGLVVGTVVWNLMLSQNGLWNFLKASFPTKG